EGPDKVLGQVVLRDARVLLSRQPERADRGYRRRRPGAHDAKGEARGDRLESGHPPVRVVREEERVPVRVEVESRDLASDALKDQVDVGAEAVDVMEVHQDEEDV